MNTVTGLLAAVVELHKLATNSIEELGRLTLAGETLDTVVARTISDIQSLCIPLGITPTIIVGGNTIGPDEAEALSDYLGRAWRLVLGKSTLAGKMQARDGENTFLFFTISGFLSWVGALDPFTLPAHNEPDLAVPTTIRVHGLSQSFGGPLLWILPIESSVSSPTTLVDLPNTEDIQGLIHLNANTALRVCPASIAMTWGDFAQPSAKPFLRLSALTLAACLVQELRRTDTEYEVTLRGTRRLSLKLIGLEDTVSEELVSNLLKAVAWVYEERSETRLKLVMDRLSIDIQDGQSLISGMSEYLLEAMQQAKDSYAFVILERKDAYHKEMRELMKDMKSQADLYASKVRDLVASLTRDVLGILVLIGFSFIGKFDQKNLMGLLTSNELALMTKFLAGYLVLSCVLQLVTHWRDASLAYSESRAWLDVLQHYTSIKDKKDRFLDPIDRRKFTLNVAMAISFVIYAVIAVVTWNLPFCIELLLAQ